MSDERKVTDDVWLKLAQDAYLSSSNYFDTNVRNRIINDIRQFQSKHPEGSKYFSDSYKLKSKLFRPKTRSSIRKNEATAASAFFSTEDVVSVRPMDDSDPLQVAAAKLHKSLLQYRLTKPKPHGLPWFLTCIGAYQEAQTVGIVSSFQEWVKNDDKGIDRPDVKLLPVENVLFDPAADWRDVVESSPYIIIQWPMYIKDVKARMARMVLVPGAEEDYAGNEIETEVLREDKEGRPWRHCTDALLSAAASRSNDTVRQTREKDRTDSKNAAATTDYTIVWVHQNFVEVDGKDMMYYTLGDQHMLSDPVPTRKTYPQGRPVVVGFSILEAHTTYPSSQPSMTRDIQGEINDVANLRIDNVKLMLHKRHIVKRGSQVDLRSLTRNIAGSVTLANDINAVKFVTTDDATGSSYQEQDRLNLDFDDLSGAFSGSSVSSNRRLNETVGGMNILNDNADQVANYQLRTFNETWVEPVLRQLTVLEQVYETDERVLEICGRNAGIDFEEFNLPDSIDNLIMQDSILTVSVGTGSTNTKTQVDNFAFGMKTLREILGDEFIRTANPKEIVSELFGKLGYKDGVKFFNGLADNDDTEEGEETIDPRLTEAMQIIEQLKQQLQLKNPQEVVEAQVRKIDAETDLKRVEATNKRVEALYSAMSTAEVAVQVPGVTVVADQIAKSAGFEDQDAGTIIPDPGQAQEIPPEAVIPKNTSPMHPANPSRGMNLGIESGQGVQYDGEQSEVVG